ncbi:hypothetical protein KCU77_g5816, partial [Aureobasidium melanogenum]
MTTGLPPSVNADSVIDLEKETVSIEQNPSRTRHLLLSSLTFVRATNGKFVLRGSHRIRSIPPLVIGFLDLANSGDFAANVFNHVPVPVYAIVLMAIGATIALIMSSVALRDITCSWKNIRLLREERACLKSVDGDKSVELKITHRDLGTEIFDRAGVDMAMGIGAFLIAVGTYMAIGGANHKVWFASNLLSGYIGNALPALYGLCNVGWSVHVWVRAHKQACAASQHLHDDVAKQLLSTRIRKTQGHAILTAIVCLVSGALSMVTPTHWWPYPVLLVCGLAFVYGTWVYRTQIGYERPMLKEDTVLDESLLIVELLHQSIHISKRASLCKSFKMHFSSLITPVVALLATTTTASPIEKREVSPDTMVQTIQKITQQSKSLTTVAEALNPMNGVPLLGPSSGSGSSSFNDVINGFQGIIQTGTTAITNMQGTPSYTDTAAEQEVCDAFHEFVVVHQNLLNVVIGKSGLLQSIFLGPVAAVLRSLEGVVDTLSFGVIDSVPFCADNATSDKDNLDGTLSKAICAYTPGGSLGVDVFC